MLLKKITFLLIMATAFFSCSKKEVPGKRYDVRTEFIDGVKVLTNPGYPRDGRLAYNLVEELSIGEEKGEDPYILNQPIDLKVDDEGNIYVLDWGETRIQVYDSQGKYLRTIGRKGQGPGDFDTPCFFALSSDGKIFLMDGRNQRVSIFDTRGNYLSSFRIEGFHYEMKTDAQNRLYFQKRVQEQEVNVLNVKQEIENIIKIYRTDQTGASLFHLGDFRGEKWVTRRTSETSSVSSGGLFIIIWTISGEGKLFVGCNETYQLSVYSADGKLEFRFGREYSPVDNKYYKGLLGQKKYMPAFRRIIIFDEKGNLWIEPYTADETIINYDVFSPEGIYLQQVTVANRIYQFKNGKAYSLIRPEDSFAMVKRFRLEPIK